MRAQDKGLFYTRNIFVLFIDKRVLSTTGNFRKFLLLFGEFFMKESRARGLPLFYSDTKVQ